MIYSGPCDGTSLLYVARRGNTYVSPTVDLAFQGRLLVGLDLIPCAMSKKLLQTDNVDKSWCIARR